MLKEEPLSRRVSGATRRCNRSSKPPGPHTSSQVSAFVSAPIDTPLLPLGSVGGNQLCGLYDEDGGMLGILNDEPIGTYTTLGITKMCEGLKGSAVTSLRRRHPSVPFCVTLTLTLTLTPTLTP